MRSVTVFVRLPSGESLAAADLLLDDEITRSVGGGSFRYTQEYLRHREAYPFDPINLPLDEREVTTEGLPGVPLVIAEALPDRWGRRLLARAHRINESDVPSLLRVARPPNVGALRFVADDHAMPVPELGELVETARRIEEGLPVDQLNFARLLRHGSSVGGARPKALFRDDTGDYVAKFPSVRDPGTVSIPRLEGAFLDLAAVAGLDACRSRVVSIADRDVLLVRRFDLLAGDGRKHILSLRALGIGPDGRIYSYREAAALIRRVVTDVDANLKRFFRQMVFNVAIGNTDDHEGNFSFLFDGNEWSLSPAYDLLPDIAERTEHALDFESLPIPPDRRRAVGLAHAFSLAPEEATDIIDEVAAAVGDLWRTTCRKHGVDVDVDWFWAHEIDRRVRYLHR